jgi:hypothetical protein
MAYEKNLIVVVFQTYLWLMLMFYLFILKQIKNEVHLYMYLFYEFLFCRFVEALKHQLKEKTGIKGKRLPALCCCGETLWETNPDTCANNCVFYRNHRGE